MSRGKLLKTASVFAAFFVFVSFVFVHQVQAGSELWDQVIQTFSGGFDYDKAYSLAFGSDNKISSEGRSLALGWDNDISSERSNGFALGWRNIIGKTGPDGLLATYASSPGYAFGFSNQLHTGYALGKFNKIYSGYSLGDQNQTLKKSFAFGDSVSASGKYSFVIGAGGDVAKRDVIVKNAPMAAGSFESNTESRTITNTTLHNDVDYSFMVGFNSYRPSLFVKGGNGKPWSYGMVGINTKHPKSSLHINGNLQVKPLASEPIANHCTDKTKGRIEVSDSKLYVCTSTGWKGVDLN